MFCKLGIVVVIACCLACADHAAASEHSPVAASDIAQIYERFLDGWMGKKKSPLNVALEAEAPSQTDLKEFSECAGRDGASDPHWLPAAPKYELSDSIGTLPYVRLINSEKWQPDDPGELIARGKPIESAVQSGFVHGLLTFSTIVFDESHTVAAFTYSFVCGALCGSGSAVIFRKSDAGWIKAKRQCSGWVS